MNAYSTLLILALVPILGLQAQENAKRPKLPAEAFEKSLIVESPKKNVRKGKKVSARTVPVIYYSLLSKASGNAVAISAAEKSNGSVAIESTSQLSHEQQWQLKPIDGEWFQLIARHSGKALTVRDTAQNSIIQRDSSPKNESTHWNVVSDSGGFVRLVNRTSNLWMGVSKINCSLGDGVVQSKKAETDRQKWKLQVAEIDHVKVLPFKKLALPASEIIGKKHPTSMEELREFLHGTTWSIRYGSTAGDEEYQMTFDKKGTLTLHYGRVSKLEILGPKTIKLWAYDTAALSDAFNYFQAADANGKVYFGVLLPNED